MRVSLLGLSALAVAFLCVGCSGSLEDRMISAMEDLNAALDKVKTDDDVKSQKDAVMEAAKAVNKLGKEAKEKKEKDGKEPELDKDKKEKIKELGNEMEKHASRIMKLEGGMEFVMAVFKEMGMENE